MDIRTMQYYLAVVREGTISAAAEALHVAQPSLSRQMKELEDELGVTLFERGNRRISLTEEGMVLRKRAEEMVRLMQMTEEEISQVRNNYSGTISIGAGESQAFHYISRAASELSEEYPDIRFSVTSGDTQDLVEELNRGLIDLALIFSDTDTRQYHSIPMPVSDEFGVLMPQNDILAGKQRISAEDLKNRPVIISRASEPYLRGSDYLSGLHVIGTYTLIYNASLMVEDGLGLALCFDKLVNTTGSPLAFRPLAPELKVTGKLIWKKYQVLSPVVQLFIDRLKESISKQ